MGVRRDEMDKIVKMTFLGAFKKAYGSGQVSLEIEKEDRLRDIIQKITESSSKLKRLLVDPELNDPLPNAVILINGKDINLLKGLETEVGNKDEIVFIPVIHGGVIFLGLADFLH